MIESIYVDSQHIDGLEESGANHLMVTGRTITPESWENLRRMGFKLSIAVDAFKEGLCPANPVAQRGLSAWVSELLDYQPEEIWLDHFRFDGHWEAIKDNKIPGLHGGCQWCRGKNRTEILENMAGKLEEVVGDKTALGYFAVPFFPDKVPDLVNSLGQDHQVLGKIFDISSPMLYHRMVGKQPGYISKYVGWMARISGKPVLPIIQIKDMPDDLPDEMTEDDIKEAFDEAKKKPSAGVAIFWWQHALEKNKTEIVSGLFKH